MTSRSEYFEQLWRAGIGLAGIVPLWGRSARPEAWGLEIVGSPFIDQNIATSTQMLSICEDVPSPLKGLRLVFQDLRLVPETVLGLVHISCRFQPRRPDGRFQPR